MTTWKYFLVFAFAFLLQLMAPALLVADALKESGQSCFWTKAPRSSVDKLCGKAKACCNGSGLNDYCEGNAETSQEKRDYAWNSFHSLKKELAPICCKGLPLCTKKFGELQLWIDNGMPAKAESDAFYDVTLNVVRYGDAGIYKCHTKGCIDFTLLHEMGHACQNAIIFEAKQGKPGNSVEDWGRTVYSELFKVTLGAKTGQCVTDALESHVKVAQTKPDFLGAWQSEAFADLIFMDKWKSLEGIAHVCAGSEDKEHAQPQVYLHCYGNRGELAKTSDPYKYGRGTLTETVNVTASADDKPKCEDLAPYFKLSDSCKRINATYKLKSEDIYNHSAAEVESRYPGLTLVAKELGIEVQETALCTESKKMETVLKQSGCEKPGKSFPSAPRQESNSAK